MLSPCRPLALKNDNVRIRIFLEHEKDKESDLYMYLRELKDQLVCMFNINESHSKRVKSRNSYFIILCYTIFLC